MRKLFRRLLPYLAALALLLMTYDFLFWYAYDLGNTDMLNFIRSLQQKAHGS